MCGARLTTRSLHNKIRIMNENSHSEQNADQFSGEQRNVVRSLAKGFRVLQAFSPDRPEMNLAEIARAADVDNATAFRFINTLRELGYVARVEGSKRFRLTLKCLDIGFSVVARTPLRDLARPLLRELVGEQLEAASLAVPDGPDMVYVERVQAGLARLGVDVHVGSRAPAHSTAVGQAVLAWLPAEARTRVLGARPLDRRTPATITDPAMLEAKLARIRAEGFALSDQENVTGLRVIAAPVLDADGVPAAAVSIAAPAFAMPLAAFVQAARDPVIRVAADLSRALAASGGAALPFRRGA
jgi:IclR family pca regulon transcriptional regulator